MVIALANMITAGCALCSVMAIQSGGASSATVIAETNENVKAAGVLKCEIMRDIRAMVRSERRLRCEFRPEGGLPDRMVSYRGSIRDLEAGVPSADGDVLAWTVLILNSDGVSGSEGDAKIAGA